MKIVEYSKGSITEVENVFKVVESGAQGPAGEKGDTGDTGATGAKGDTGDKGDTGAGLPAGGDTGDSVIKSSGIDFAFIILKNNLTAIIAPTVNEDSDDGYAVKSLWFDTVSAKVYQCLDASVGAAVWVDLSASGGGGGGGIETFIETIDLTAWGSHIIDIDLTQAGYADTYDDFMFKFEDITKTGTLASMYARASVNGFVATLLGNYQLATRQTNNTVLGNLRFENTANTKIVNNWAANPGTIGLTFRLFGVNGLYWPRWLTDELTNDETTGSMLWQHGHGGFKTKTGMTDLRFEFSNAAVDFTGGKLHIYGVKYGT